MPNFTDLTGLAGIACAMAATMLLVPGIARPSAILRTGLAKTHMAILFAAVFVLMLIPFNGMPLAAYLRGVTGDLSITTLVLLGCALLKPWCVELKSNNHFVLLILITLAALALYPMALGVGAFDPYRLGYGELLFIAALLLLALAAWLLRYSLITLCIALATLSWAVGWYESSNLWDYLLDPFVSVYALGAIAIQAIKMVKIRLQDKPLKL